MRFERRTSLFGAVLAAAGCLVGCTQTSTQQAPLTTLGGKANFIDMKTNVTHVEGYVWDPEAFWLTVASCDPTKGCTLPPIVLPGVPATERSEVAGAMVSLFDPLADPAAPPQFVANAPTDQYGGWYMDKVTSRKGGPPFIPVAIPPAPGGTPLKDNGPPFLDPIPPADYLPTMALKPIFTEYTNCLGQSVPIASDKGVLEAVAKYLTANGTTTTAADFIDPSKYGGVLIAWYYLPSDPPVRLPAFNTVLSTTAGTIYNINWAPPKALPPFMNQSTRGFFVDTSTTGSPFGLFVVTLPPLMGPPSPVSLTITDPITDAPTGRPWTFPDVPPQILPPGLISYLELQGNQPGRPPPAQWVCLYPNGAP